MKNLMKKVIAWAMSDLADPFWYLTEEDYADNSTHSLFVFFALPFIERRWIYESLCCCGI